MSKPLSETSYLPGLIYQDGHFLKETALIADSSGRIVKLVPGVEAQDPIRLQNKVLLPGLINAHSHAFQRVIRGRTEYRSQNEKDSFWTWRDQMYAAANKLSPEDVYDASSMAFLEMALGGITAVGEFHYIHHAPNGQPYDDPNLLAKEVIRAANDVGLRIALLRVAYERAGFQKDPNPLQQRFIEGRDVYLASLLSLNKELSNSRSMAWAGAAPHSVRAVTLDYLKSIGSFVKENNLQIHMHVAEQPAEVTACIDEYGRSPVSLLDTEDLLSERFTLVHAIHVTPKAIGAIAQRGALVCACPSTERNLGDGVVPADGYFEAGVKISLGTDSQTQIDLLEDARELEYHLRLQRTQRNVLVPDAEGQQQLLGKRLFECATVNGARSIGGAGGVLEPGSPADFFTVDLNDPSISGASDENLLANIVFSLARTAIKDVVVSNQLVVSDGRHIQQERIVERFKALQVRLWN